MSTEESKFVPFIAGATKAVLLKFSDAFLMDAVAQKLGIPGNKAGKYTLDISPRFAVQDANQIAVQDDGNGGFQLSSPTKRATGTGSVKDTSKVIDPSTIIASNASLKSYDNFRLYKYAGSPDGKKTDDPCYEFRDSKNNRIGKVVYSALDGKPYEQ